MKSFEIKRMLNVLQWNAVTYKRNILRNSIGSGLCVLLLTLLTTGMLWGSSPVSPAMIARMGWFVLIGYAIGMIVNIGRVGFNMRTKNDIVSYSMLPATRLEKFVSGIITQTVIHLICVTLAIAGADILQMIMSCTLTGAYFSIIYAMGEQLSQIVETGSAMHITTATLAYLSTMSTFLLGGTFFRKNPVLCTVIANIILTSALGFTIGFGVDKLSDWLTDNHYVLTIEPLIGNDTVNHLFWAFLLIYTSFKTWLAYWLYSRTQVISNKLFNV